MSQSQHTTVDDLEPISDKFEKTPSGCWEWTESTTGGYGDLRWDGRVRKAHRVAYSLANGGIPDGKQVNHHCDNPPCVRPDHLYAGTQSENMKDAYRRGGKDIVSGEDHPMYGADQSGESNGNSKLTERDVVKIRERYDNGGVTQKELGDRYDIETGSVCSIVRGKSWENAPGPTQDPYSAFGENNSSKKLDRESVVKLREEYACTDATMAELADELDVSLSNVALIVNGETWEDAGGPINE